LIEKNRETEFLMASSFWTEFNFLLYD